MIIIILIATTLKAKDKMDVLVNLPNLLFIQSLKIKNARFSSFYSFRSYCTYVKGSGA